MAVGKIFMIAGEASGDKLGGRLLAALKKCMGGDDNHTLDIKAVGGRWVQEQGVQSLFPMEEISLMGLLEVLPHIFNLQRRIRETVTAIEEFQPDVLVTIDSPGFCNRVVEALHKNGQMKNTKFVHYVAPTVWAYKPQRAANIARLFDHLMVLFPFEPRYFEAEGLPTTFVGHPVTEDIRVTDTYVENLRASHNLAEDEPVICAFSGSRSGEINRMLPIFADVFPKLNPQMRVVLPTTPEKVELVQSLTKNWAKPPVIVTSEEDKKAALKISDIALVKSGSITLEVAMAEVPMVTTYRVNPLTAMLMRRVITTPYANLVNILQNELVVPELIQEDCTVEKLTSALQGLIGDGDVRRNQSRGMQDAVSKLDAPGGGTASDKAATVIYDYVFSA